jgi:hypothetical protein
MCILGEPNPIERLCVKVLPASEQTWPFLPWVRSNCDEGEYMSLLKNRPKCIRVQSFIKLMQNFYRGNK